MLLGLLLGAASASANPPALSDGSPILPCAKAPRGMACIAGGAFLRGSNDGPKNTRPQATVELQTFYMDHYEVTVADYEACVARKRCQAAKTAYRDYSRPTQPKTGVNWYHADTYCKALGKHLPTEAEWEKAARGTDGRLYPWGNQVADCKRAVIEDSRGRSCGVKKLKGTHPEKGRTLVVGSRAPGMYGLYDMTGNSWEWVYDWYSSSYKSCGKDCLGVDPKGPCGGAEPCKRHGLKIVRGGSWYWPCSYATTTYRRHHVPKNRPYHHFGFRCAASVAEAAKLPR